MCILTRLVWSAGVENRVQQDRHGGAKECNSAATTTRQAEDTSPRQHDPEAEAGSRPCERAMAGPGRAGLAGLPPDRGYAGYAKDYTEGYAGHPAVAGVGDTTTGLRRCPDAGGAGGASGPPADP